MQMLYDGMSKLLQTSNEKKRKSLKNFKSLQKSKGADHQACSPFEILLIQ